MQKPRFKTTEKAAWVFIHTKLHPQKPKTIDRRRATRCGYLLTASRLLRVPEAELPCPRVGESMSQFVQRVKSQGKR